MALETLLTAVEVAQVLRLKKSCVYRLMGKGSIPTVRVTDGLRKNALRVRPSDLETWLERRKLSKRFTREK